MVEMRQRFLLLAPLVFLTSPVWSQSGPEVRAAQSADNERRVMEVRTAPRPSHGLLQAACTGPHAESAVCIQQSAETCRERGGQEQLTQVVTARGEVSVQVNCNHKASAPRGTSELARSPSAHVSCLQGTICSCSGTSQAGPDSAYNCTAQMLVDCASNGGIINHLGYSHDGSGGSTGHVQCLRPY